MIFFGESILQRVLYVIIYNGYATQCTALFCALGLLLLFDFFFSNEKFNIFAY